MFGKIKKEAGKLWQRLTARHMYVIADPSDSSLTMSKALFNWVLSHSEGLEKAYVKMGAAGRGERADFEYVFVVNPEGRENLGQVEEIQYNPKYKCVGFETLQPTVARIFYDYGLPARGKVKLSVRMETSGEGGVTYFVICRPGNKK